MHFKEISFEEIMENIRHIEKELKSFKADLILSLGNGGLVPAAILSHILRTRLDMICIQYYEDGMKPEKKYSEPTLITPFVLDIKGKKIILVDDFQHSGASMEKAIQILKDNGATNIKSIVIAGNAGALIQSEGCVKFPWNTARRLSKGEGNEVCLSL
ncbi:phosphoribosyltransferase [Candidatus Undinarchaeota archaeon]